MTWTCSRFQSTPAFSGEGTASSIQAHRFRRRFNPPPPFQARELRSEESDDTHVSTSFNPPPPFQAREHDTRITSKIRICFNPPPPFQARELVRFFGHRVLHLFQSTPAFSGEGTIRWRLFLHPWPSFNPPPPFQAREHKAAASAGGRDWFQSTPAFSGEGTLPAGTSYADPNVSIHPRLFRRGNDRDESYLTYEDSFNPPPPFQARELNELGYHQQYGMFQSTPAFSGEGTTLKLAELWLARVSIHPRLFRRGNLLIRTLKRLSFGFNPPPPFQAREHT